jgi:hypothetical protein
VLRVDPRAEVDYRLKLCLRYLERAEKFLRTGDYKESAEASQLSAENAAKAVIALKRLPSWSPTHRGNFWRSPRSFRRKRGLWQGS